MNELSKKIKETLTILNKEDVLKDIIIIGSWCTYFYDKLFEGYTNTLMTTDIDFFVPNAKKIKERESIIKAFKTINYDVETDLLSNKSKFISPDGFELEFLTKLYRKSSNVIELGNTGIYAESLSYLDIYIKNYIEIKFNGLHVKIASPASYVLQKLLINDSRGSKRQKDLESINHILHYINLSKSSTNELKSLYETLPKKWKKKINKTISVYRLPLSL